jgi:hypothetical protein
MIIYVLVCLAAVFVGWTLGPVVKQTYTKVKDKVIESAKKSEEKSKKDNKYYSTLSIPYFSEEKEFKNKSRYDFFIIIFSLSSLAAALIFNNAITWKVFGIALLIMTWDKILEMLNPFGGKD